MNIVVNPDLQAYIDPLTPQEHAALERSLLAEGCRDALVLWGDMLVDGHNRYGICQQHGLPFQTVQNTHFQTLEDVHLWMIDQHLGRRSVSDFQRGVLALRKRTIVADRQARAAAAAEPGAFRTPDAPATASSTPEATPAMKAAPPADAEPLNSREAVAKAARLSSNQVVMIEKIQKQAAPELVAALKSGSISLNAAAAIATLPAQEQVNAAMAGSGELKQAAKRVREAQRKPRATQPASEQAPAQDGDQVPGTHTDGVVQHLQQQVAELTKENEALRREVAQLQATMAITPIPQA